MKNVRYKFLFSIFFACYIFESCGNSNSLPTGKLNSGIWKCFSQISDLYTANGLSVQTSLGLLVKVKPDQLRYMRVLKIQNLA